MREGDYMAVFLRVKYAGFTSVYTTDTECYSVIKINIVCYLLREIW